MNSQDTADGGNGALGGADPWAILGVDQTATDEQIRQAYLHNVRLHPPDRDQQQFERIRDAYELLRDPRRRARQLILAVDPLPNLPDLLDGPAPRRKHVGPKPWLDACRRPADCRSK